jgi:hypothetical protein
MLFKLSVPPDTRLVGIVYDLALRIGQEHGLAVRDAESIARVVDEAVAEGIRQSPSEGRVDLSFRTDAARIEISVFYPLPAGIGRGAAVQARPPRAAAEVMDIVEQRLEGGMVHHRMVRNLPGRSK